MFKDYWKLNKISTIGSSVLIGLNLLLNAGLFIFLNYLVTHQATSFGERYYMFVNMINKILFLYLILIALFLIATLVRNSLGKVRQLLLLHRGRKYYIRYQLMFITLSAIISGLLVFISSTTILAYNVVTQFSEQSITTLPPADAFIISGNGLSGIAAGLAVIAIYYVIIYIIDIWNNMELKYQPRSKTYLKLASFIIRCVLICGSVFYLILSIDNLPVVYESPYFNLLSQPYQGFTAIMLLGLTVVTICLVIDYIVFFKKKVII